MDSQVVELLGRNRLIDELLRAGLEVARSLRDRGIDLTIADEIGWTGTRSWHRGNYTNTRPGKRLRGLLERSRMTPARWWKWVTGGPER